MTGLLVKDLILLKRTVKNMIGIIVIFTLPGWFDESNGMMLAIAFVLSMNVMSSFSYDEFSHWETYALTMPINKRTYVNSKYVLGGILSLIGTLIVVLLLTAKMLVFSSFDGELVILSAVVALFGSYALTTISLPILFKYPVEKARFTVMGTIMAMTVSGLGINFVAKKVGFEILPKLAMVTAGQFIGLVIVVTLIIIFFSYLLSSYFFKQKYS